MKLVRKTEIVDGRNYWDMTIPVNHNFVLENGVVVHNCGAGVGFSVERQFIAELPVIADRMLPSRTVIKVEDSKIGWADAFRELISMLYQGRIPEWDVSEVRPAGAKLKTFGGRASGPKPLVELFQFAIGMFREAKGRRLTSIECHDLCCKIGEVVVVGGVRRSAEISLSNPSDDRMRYAKSGNWHEMTPWRQMANNCLAKGTLVLKRGDSCCPIEEVKVGDEVVSSLGWGKVTNVFPQGLRPTVFVKHGNGWFRCTPDHRVAVVSSLSSYEWKKAGELEVGDYLVTPQHSDDGGEDVMPEEWQRFDAINSKKLGEMGFVGSGLIIDEKLAWMFGVFCGDGSVGDNGRIQTCFGEEERLMACEYMEQMNRLGLSGKIVHHKTKKCWLVTFNSKRLVGLLERFKSSDRVRIPKFVRTAKVRSRAAFIQGVMDADGSVRTKPIQLVCSTDEVFVSEIQSMLCGMGIRARLKSLFVPEDGWGKRPQFGLSLVNKRDKTGFANLTDGVGFKKYDVSDRYRNTDGFPVDVVRDAGYNEHTAGFNIHSRVVPVDGLDSKGVGFRYIPSAVEDVAEGGDVEVFDLEIDGHLRDSTQSYVGAGVLQHNSVCYTEKPGMDIFFREWMALYESKSGERGIFNRQAAKAQAAKYGRRDTTHLFGCNPCVTDDTWILTDKGPEQVVDLIGKPFGAVVDGEVYDCQTGFFFTGEKDVFSVKTDRGYELKATDNHPILVERSRKTVYRRDGGSKRKAGYERELDWVQVKDLKIGDKLVLGNHEGFSWGTTGEEELGWLVGEIVGDGGYNPEKYPAYLRFWGESAKEMADVAADIVRRRLPKSSQFKGATYNKENETWQVSCKALDQLCHGLIAPSTKDVLPALEKASSSFVTGFIRGFFDADGCPQGNLAKGRSVRLGQSNRTKLLAVQRMLSRIGIVSTITNEKRDRTQQLMPDGSGGHKLYWSEPYWELIVARNCLDRFAEIIGFYDPDKCRILEGLCASRTKTSYEDTFTSEVVSIDKVCKMSVYDCTVEVVHRFDANGIVVHNCSEIILRSRQFCNLSEVVIRPTDTIDDLKRKVRIATIIGTMQATLTNFRYLGPKWKKNTEEESLLGVSLTGIADNELTSGRKGKKELKEALDILREVAVGVNKEWAGIIGINPSAAITCVKPSGCATLDTKIKTNKGVLSFAEIFQINGVNPIGLHEDMWIDPTIDLWVWDKDNKPKPVKKLYVNGVTEVYELEDENGQVFKFTGNHEFLTTKGWKRVDELTVEDDIVSFQ
jgi:intein/homing endonuclease